MLTSFNHTALLTDDKRDRLIWIALILSFVLHGISLFFNLPQPQTRSFDLQKPVVISSGNMQVYSKFSSINARKHIPEVKLDIPNTAAVSIPKTTNSPEPANAIKAPLTQPTAMEGILVAPSPSPPPAKIQSNSPLKAVAAESSYIGIQDILPVGNFGTIVNTDEIAISFIDITANNELIDNKIADEVNVDNIAKVSEDIPVITEAATKDSKKAEASPLAGITANFKKLVRNKLIKAILSIKPKVEQQKLEGSLRFQFTVDRDGNLVSRKIIKSSRNKKLDGLVLKMLKDYSPYIELPDEYQGNFLKFSYPVTVKLK